MRILAGDIGGTKTALGLYEPEPLGTYRTLERAVFPSSDYPSLRAVLEHFLGAAPRDIAAAALGIAGPVRGGTCVTTNLPWTAHEAELARWLGAPVRLINDFHAVTLGVLELPDSALQVVQAGARDPRGVFAVIGAGTGLGEAVGVPEAGGLRVWVGEGGHADFAPRTEREMRLANFLAARHGHVSIERVVSGPGLCAIYEFVVHEGIAAGDPKTVARFAGEPAAAVIAEQAASGADAAAGEALAMFVSLYGAEAGNLALRMLPAGGVYIAGGIAYKLLPRMTDGAFLASFLAKGRMSKILETVHVAVVLEPDVGLLGARAHAAVLSEAT
jgi:glucokinase